MGIICHQKNKRKVIKLEKADEKGMVDGDAMIFF